MVRRLTGRCGDIPRRYWGAIGLGADSGCLGALMRAGADASAVVDARSGGEHAGSTAVALACQGVQGLAASSSPTGAAGGAGRAPRLTTPRTPRTPSSAPGTPRPKPSREDVELLLRLGPDAYEAQKQAEIDAAAAR
jgi:hypothetical protein